MNTTLWTMQILKILYICTPTLPLSHDSWQLLLKDIYLLTAKRLSGPMKPQKKMLGGNIVFSPIFEARCLDFVVLALYATLNIIAFQSTLCIQQTGCINRQSTDFLGGSGRSMPSPNNYSYVIVWVESQKKLNSC